MITRQDVLREVRTYGFRHGAGSEEAVVCEHRDVVIIGVSESHRRQMDLVTSNKRGEACSVLHRSNNSSTNTYPYHCELQRNKRAGGSEEFKMI